MSKISRIAEQVLWNEDRVFQKRTILQEIFSKSDDKITLKEGGVERLSYDNLVADPNLLTSEALAVPSDQVPIMKFGMATSLGNYR